MKSYIQCFLGHVLVQLKCQILVCSACTLEIMPKQSALKVPEWFTVQKLEHWTFIAVSGSYLGYVAIFFGTLLHTSYTR